MKKLIVFWVLLSLSFSVYSQTIDTIPINKPIFNDGYYTGLCQNDGSQHDEYDKYLNIKFISNNGDTMIIVVPYLFKKINDFHVKQHHIEIMNDIINNYISDLTKSANDIENHEIVEYSWMIDGFDNYTYYDLNRNRLSFSINIVNPNTGKIEVLYFDGLIENNGETISATVYSDKDTFKKSIVLLNYRQTTLPDDHSFKK